VVSGASVTLRGMGRFLVYQDLYQEYASVRWCARRSGINVRNGS